MIEALIAVALLGVVALLIARFSKTAFQSQKQVRLRGELVEIKNKIRANIDCDVTTSTFASTCAGMSAANAQAVTIKGLDGSVIADGSGKPVGSYFELRSRCYDMNSAWGIEFETRVRPSKAEDVPAYAEWTPLFKSVPFSCRKILDCVVDQQVGWGKKGPGTPGMTWCSKEIDYRFMGWTSDFDVKITIVNADDSNAALKLNGVLAMSCPAESMASGGQYTHNHPTSIPFIPGINTVKSKSFDNFGGYCGTWERIQGSYKALDCTYRIPTKCSEFSVACY